MAMQVREIFPLTALLLAVSFAPSRECTAQDDRPHSTARPDSEKSADSGKLKLFPPLGSPQPPPEIDMDREVVLRGNVIGPEGRPVSGARLYLSVDRWSDPVELGTSDDEGSYRLAVPEKSFHRYADGTPMKTVRAWLIGVADGHGPAWVNLPGVDHEGWEIMKPEYGVDLQLINDHPISGRVVNSDGDPVAGAVVSVGALSSLSDDPWQPLTATIDAGNAELFDRGKYDPLAWNSPLHATTWNMLPRVTTDGDGRFRITGVGRDRAVKLNVHGPGIWSTSVGVLTRDGVEDFTRAVREKYPRTPNPHGHYYPARKSKPEGPRGVLLFGSSLTIPVDPARTVAGIVRDAVTGEPMPGVRIVVTSQGAHGTSGYTDRSGSYRLLRSEDGETIRIHAQPDSKTHLLALRLVNGATGLGEIEADFEMSRGVAVTGRVLETGTDQPIVSSRNITCHAPWPGELRAGHVYYMPLANNVSLRGTEHGLYFETLNYSRSTPIEPDGRYRIAVPHGPGVLLVRSAPGLPDFATFGVWQEDAGFHRLFPYAYLAERAADDGAPVGDAGSLPGFAGPIQLQTYHAYRVINPTPDATALELPLNVDRLPTRPLRFVGPDGNAIQGVRVRGLVAHPLMVVLDGSEAEVIGLEPDKPREVLAITNDGRYAARLTVPAGGEPMAVRLKPVASVSGRLLDAASNEALAGYLVSTVYLDFTQLSEPVQTDADGRFELRGLVPDIAVSFSFRQPPPKRPWIGDVPRYDPQPLQNLVMSAGEVRKVGDIRIERATAQSKN